MNEWKKIVLYATGVYLTFICVGLYLAHGEEAPALPAQPSNATIPPAISGPTASPLKKQTPIRVPTISAVTTSGVAFI